MRSVPKVDSAALEDTAKSALRRRSARPRDLNRLFVRRRKQSTDRLRRNFPIPLKQPAQTALLSAQARFVIFTLSKRYAFLSPIGGRVRHVPSALYRRSYAAQRATVPDRLKFRRRHIPLKSHIPRSLKSQLSRVPLASIPYSLPSTASSVRSPFSV